MSVEPAPLLRSPFPDDPEELRRHWGKMLAVGVVMIFLGAVALGCIPFVTEAFVLYLGFVLIVSGIAGGIQAFQTPRWAGFFLVLLVGILDVVVGFLMVTHVGEAAVIMTLLLAVFFFVGGLFRIIISVAIRFPSWGWSLLAGAASLLLGIMIWRQWPLSSFWVIGLFIGIELLFRGWSLVMLALTVRRLPSPSPQGN